MPGKLDLCHGDLVGLGPLWFTSNQLSKDSLFWITWYRGAPMSLANSSLQNRSLHTVRCVFPADSSYPSEVKRTPRLEVMVATLFKLILSATGYFLGFPQKICFSFFLLAFELFLYLLPAGSFVSSCRSLARRCYSLARTCGHYSWSVCQPKPRLYKWLWAKLPLGHKLWSYSQSWLWPAGSSPQASRKHLVISCWSFSTLWTFRHDKKIWLIELRCLLDNNFFRKIFNHKDW